MSERGQTDPGRIVLWLLVAVLILVFIGLVFSVGDVSID